MNEQSFEVRDMRNGDWLWTQKAILFSKYVTATDFKVYCGLTSFAGNQNQSAYPGLRRLAEDLNLSKTTVVTAIKNLERCRIISIERKKGESNVYYLVNVTTIEPQPLKKSESTHHAFVKYYDDTVRQSRGIKPTYSVKDFAALKRILRGEILTVEQLEQLALYYLASPRFKTFNPSLSVFLSPGILNMLHNTMVNYTEFYKELENYRLTYRKETMVLDRQLSQSLSDQLKALKEKMTIK